MVTKLFCFNLNPNSIIFNFKTVKYVKNVGEKEVHTVVVWRWCMLFESLSKLPSLKCELPKENISIRCKLANTPMKLKHMTKSQHGDANDIN